MHPDSNRTVKAATLVVAAFFLVTMTGCFKVDGSFRQLRDTVVEGAGYTFTTESEFGIGSFVLGAARMVIRWADDGDAEEADALLQHVKGVQLGVYRLEDTRRSLAQEPGSGLKELISFLDGRGYDAIVRSYHADGGSLILVRCEGKQRDQVKELIVVSIEASELTVVQLRGNVNEIVAFVAREHEVPEAQI
jgi:hypothetical protein